MRQLKIATQITNRDSQAVEKYLQEISKISMITPEEETILAQKIKMNDQRALDKLVQANLRFVVSVAKQYQHQGLSLSDLINEGNLGLIKAAQRFDETKGFKFISYAVWWIRQSILQSLAEQSRIVRLPLNKVGLTSRISKAYSQLEQEFEREPTADEIASYLDVGTAEVAASINAGVRHVSMDQPFAEGEDGALIDVLENPNAESTDQYLIFNVSLSKEIDRSLSSLTQRQKDVVLFFFGIGMDHALSLEDIAEKFNLTRERVRQIKDKAILKLRSVSRCKLLRSYLGA